MCLAQNNQNAITTHISKDVPDGAVNGLFSVSETKIVYFSKGNLQYKSSTDTWRFAQHQWDVVGESNKNISKEYNGWIDLFGWGTGQDPTMSSSYFGDYGTFNDWGNYVLSTGAEKWRTLTKDEWIYILSTRKTKSGIRYAMATVNGVKGLVVLPDSWESSFYKLRKPNGGRYNSNNISIKDWMSSFEKNGAVFLPVGGGRGEKKVGSIDSWGGYWSSTPYEDDGAYYMNITDNLVTPARGYLRYGGICVRLVCDVQQ